MSIMLPQLLLLVHMHRNPPSLMRGKTQGTTDLREANPTEKKQDPLHGDRTAKSLRHERGNDREIGVLSKNEWDDRSPIYKQAETLYGASTGIYRPVLTRQIPQIY